MALNMATVALAVPRGMTPLEANVLGFFLSFVWSFFAHSRWTFPAAGRDLGVALRRFAIVSLLSFVLTETVYAGALEWTSFDYRLSLFLIILTLSLGKLLASKHWAFARADA